MKTFRQKMFYFSFVLGLIFCIGAGDPAAWAGRMGGLRSSVKSVVRANRANIRQAVKPTLMISSPHPAEMTAVDFSPEHRLMAAGGKNGAVQLWRFDIGRRQVDLRSRSKEILSLAFVPGTNFLATGDEAGALTLWDVSTARRVHRYGAHSGPLLRLIPTPDGKYLLTAGRDGIVNVWPVGQKYPARRLQGEAGGQSGDQTGIQAIAINGSKLITGGSDGTLSIWDWKGGNLLRTYKIEGGGIKALAAAHTPDGRTLAVGFEDGTLAVIDPESGKTIASRKGHTGTVAALSLQSGGSALASAGGDGAVCLWSFPELKEIRRFSGHGGPVNDVAFVPGRDGHLASASSDKTVRLWKPEGKEMARLISMQRGWAVVTPEGYFDGTLDGDTGDRLDAIQWQAGGRSFSLDNFLEHYYRPAVLGRVLAGRPVADPGKMPNISDEFYLPPVVRILSPDSGGLVQDRVVTVSVEATDQGGDIDEIRLFHNGKTLDDRKAALEESDGKKVKEYQVELLDGENTFRAVGFNYIRVESEPDQVAVKYKAPDPPPPVLHVMVTGISRYENPDLNLNYGVPDAQAVLDYFAKTHTGLFDQFMQYRLFDANAAKADIYKQLEALSNIPPQDTVVIYFAGHGDTLGDNWYYVPYDLTDPHEAASLEENGISSSMLQLYITRIGARKIFLLMDACKSGAVMDAFSSYDDERHFTLLSRASGIHIAAAAGKEQSAGELETLGHGIFTYTLLDGLNGAADRAPADGNISVQETLDFIKEGVPLLMEKYRIPSRYQQRPVVNSRGQDFFVAATAPSR